LSSAHALKRHLQMHAGVKQYQCEVCGKSFSYRDAWTKHRATTHIKGSRFQCDLCEKSYTQKGHLYQHLKSHHESTLFKCPVCPDQEFSKQTIFQLHMQRMHPSDQLELESDAAVSGVEEGKPKSLDISKSGTTLRKRKSEDDSDEEFDDEMGIDGNQSEEEITVDISNCRDEANEEEEFAYAGQNIEIKYESVEYIETS